MPRDEQYAVVHRALHEMVDPDEMVVAWTVQIEVIGRDGMRYLGHRSGAGVDGTDDLMIWQAVGMIRGGMLEAEQQLIAYTVDPEDDEEDDE